MKPELFLEVTGGSSIIPLLIVMVILAIYLFNEADRRQANFNWLHPPPQMDFAIAVFIVILGILINAISIWIWRRIYNASDFDIIQLMALGLSRTLTVFGAICMVRALTKPDLGDKPWYLTWLATIIATLTLSVWR